MEPFTAIVAVTLAVNVRMIVFLAAGAGRFGGSVEPNLAICSWGIRQRVIKNVEPVFKLLYLLLVLI